MALKKAYWGIGCFWGESALAKIRGVEKTRVGYAGGTSVNPTYTNIGDHTEITEVSYNPDVVSYSDLLTWFFSHNDPTEHHKKQYQSAILYVDPEQKELAEAAVAEEQKKRSKKVETYVQKLDKFYQAEDYHQKYWLRCQPRIHKALNLSDAELVDSVLAAKINAYLAGYNDFDELERLSKEHNLDKQLVSEVQAIARAGGDPRACH
ncbi:peptide methionine sulfoxide reductase [Aphelenchoides avenae]|nr:peptide methionine sulfoxide reductase [Aphelenchus avenae]